MQDDFNRFIRRSIRQAQCNYEDIFADGACGCGMTMGDSDNEKNCGCPMTMGDSDNEKNCGCGMTMGDSDNEKNCGCGMTMGDMENTNSRGCRHKNKPGCEKNVPVMAFVEMQTFGRMYNEAEGLCRGTLFPALDKPFTGRGVCR